MTNRQKPSPSLDIPFQPASTPTTQPSIEADTYQQARATIINFLRDLDTYGKTQ